MGTIGNRKAAGLASAFSSRLNEEIRVWMTRRGENLRTLEAATGISRSRLSRTVNRDEAPINTNELELICEALGVSPTELIGIAERFVRESERKEALRPSDITGTELTPQELAEAALASAPEGYVLAAREERKLKPGEERGVEYYEG